MLRRYDAGDPYVLMGNSATSPADAGKDHFVVLVVWFLLFTQKIPSVRP
jgi:hypothetical protein